MLKGKLGKSVGLAHPEEISPAEVGQEHDLVFCSRKGTYYGITTLARQFNVNSG